MNNQLCACALCQKLNDYVRQGVKEPVLRAIQYTLDVSFAGKVFEIPADVTAEQFLDEEYNRQFDAAVARYQELYAAASSLIENGELRDSDFMDAVVNPDAVKTANLNQRIKDHAAHRRN